MNARTTDRIRAYISIGRFRVSLPFLLTLVVSSKEECEKMDKKRHKKIFASL